MDKAHVHKKITTWTKTETVVLPHRAEILALHQEQSWSFTANPNITILQQFQNRVFRVIADIIYYIPNNVLPGHSITFHHGRVKIYLTLLSIAEDYQITPTR